MWLMMRQVMTIFLAIGLMGCSAIELSEQNAEATAQAENAIQQTVESRIVQQQSDANATLDSLYNDVTADVESLQTQVAQATSDANALETQIAQTITAITTSVSSSSIESTAEVIPDITSDFVPSTAGISVYGTVPIDSDSLNSITALALDSEGQLLVSLRAGEIYRLLDSDNDDEADEITLIFEDEGNDIGQVSGLWMENNILYVINGNQLSQLQDEDDDGVYDLVMQLTDELPENQALLQANNSILRSPDGRYFTADVQTGNILLIEFGE